MSASIVFSLLFLADAAVLVVSQNFDHGDKLCLAKDGVIESMTLTREGDELKGTIPDDRYTRALVGGKSGLHIPSICDDGTLHDCGITDGRRRLKVEPREIDTFYLELTIPDEPLSPSGFENISLSLHQLDCTLGGQAWLPYSKFAGETIHFQPKSENDSVTLYYGALSPNFTVKELRKYVGKTIPIATNRPGDRGAITNLRAANEFGRRHPQLTISQDE